MTLLRTLYVSASLIDSDDPNLRRADYGVTVERGRC